MDEGNITKTKRIGITTEIKKMKNKKIIRYALFSFLLFVFGIICLLFFKNKRLIIDISHNDTMSFYYRDTLDLDIVFPEYSNLPVVVNNNNVTVDNRKLYFKEPELLRVEDIDLNIVFGSSCEKISKRLKVRCWREENNEIVEDTQNAIYKGSYLRLLINKIAHGSGKNSVIACGDSLYEFKTDGTIRFLYKESVEIIDTDIKLSTSEYNQMVKGDSMIFLRNGPEILVTTDNFHSYRQIYKDRRGIKESMIWDADRRRLLFTMYTPGDIRLRHYLLSYNPAKDRIDTLQTFYTPKEHYDRGFNPYCRHIHLLTQDPYTGYVFIGVGDYDEEPAIYMSRDGGDSLECIGRGVQMWRTLSIFFTEKFIFWTTDSESPQYIFRVDRKRLTESLPLKNNEPIRFPLYNSALWCNVRIDDNNYYLGSNSEGCYYDNYHRIYRVHFGSDGVPTVYSVLEELSLPEKDNGIKFHQVSPLCIDALKNLWCYDTHLGIRKFKIHKW